MPESESNPQKGAGVSTVVDASEAVPSNLSALVVSTAAGDRRAFRLLYDSTNHRLYGVALGIIKNAVMAEEVLQDAYVRVWTEAWRYDPERGPAMPWLSRIVQNLAIDYLRRQRHSHEDIADQAEDLVEPDEPIDDRTDLIRGISSLSADHQEVLTLAFIHGYTHDELAEQLGVPLGTAKSRVRRGLNHLRAYFERQSAGLWSYGVA